MNSPGYCRTFRVWLLKIIPASGFWLDELTLHLDVDARSKFYVYRMKEKQKCKEFGSSPLRHASWRVDAATTPATRALHRKREARLKLFQTALTGFGQKSTQPFLGSRRLPALATDDDW